MIHCSLYKRNIFEVMIKSITNFLIIFFIFQQLKSQISQIDQIGYNAFCDETLQTFCDEISVCTGTMNLRDKMSLLCLKFV